MRVVIAVTSLTLAVFTTSVQAGPKKMLTQR